jgi:hypothetical protein
LKTASPDAQNAGKEAVIVGKVIEGRTAGFNAATSFRRSRRSRRRDPAKVTVRLCRTRRRSPADATTEAMIADVQEEKGDGGMGGMGGGMGGMGMGM